MQAKRRKGRGAKRKRRRREEREEGMALNAERFQREDLTQQFLAIFQDFEFCDTQQEIEAPSSSITVSSTSPAAETYQDLV